MKNAVLWKRILNEGLDKTCEFVDGPSREQMVTSIISSPIIISPFGGEKAMPKWSELKPLSIPFPKFWVEMKGLAEFDDGQIAEVPMGALCEFDRESRMLSCVGVLGRQSQPPEMIGRISVRMTESLDLPLNDDGTLRGAVIRPTAYYLDVLGRDLRQLNDVMAHPMALTCECLMLLGCKNISLEPRNNDPTQVRRAVKRHGNQSHGYRYHVLTVRPPGSKPGTKGEEIGTMPRHVCRGHFSEYGPEFNKGLLFGKYAGRFYIPPHMKGKKENGEVAKDYAIGPR